MLEFLIFVSLAFIAYIQVKGLRSKWESMTEEAINTSLSRLDHFADGMRYTGSSSRVVLTKKYRLKSTEDPSIFGGMHFRIEQLCRTDSDNWFVLAFEINKGVGSVDSFVISPASESHAKKVLQDFPEEYAIEFGEPEIA